MELGLFKFLLVAFSILCISFLGIILNRSNIIIRFIYVQCMRVNMLQDTQDWISKTVEIHFQDSLSEKNSEL